MGRFKNANWNLPTNNNGKIETWDAVRTAVLMDIRDELQTLNRLLGCQNFIDIPRDLRAMKRELATIRKASTK